MKTMILFFVIYINLVYGEGKQMCKVYVKTIININIIIIK